MKKTKRETVLESARLLFAQQGFAGTTMDAVAEHAGVSKMTVYAHFHSKEQLFDTVSESVTQALAAQWQRLGEVELPIQERLLTVAKGMLALGRTPEVVLIDPSRSTCFSACELALQDLLQRAVQAGALRIDDIASATAQFLGMIAACLASRMPPGPQRDDYVVSSVALFVRAHPPAA